MKNLIWRYAERCGAQLVQFVVSIILARLLAPELYGSIALITVFTTLLNVFVDSGLGTALIQKKDADDKDFSSVFFFNIGMCSALYGLMFLAAPVIAGFYGTSELIPVIRVQSLTLVISGLKNVQQAYVSRTMQFKRFFFATLGGTLCAAAVGILMAYRGYGIWALVVQNLVNTAIDTIILWFVVDWHPKFVFSLRRLKGLFSFGWKILVASLINTTYNQLWQLLIGKKYSSADLAYYNKGDSFPNIIVANINSSIDSILLPTMSQEQDDRKRVKAMTRRAIKTSVYLMAPLMIGLAATAERVVSLLLTEKWLPCVFFLRIFCVSYLFQPIHTANLNAVNAMGRSDYFLKLEICKKSVGLALLLSSMWFGVKAMAGCQLLASVISQIINAWPNKRLIGYSYLEQLKDIFPSVGLAVFMGGCVYFEGCLPIGIPQAAVLALQVVTGALIYICGSHLLKLDSYGYVADMLHDFLGVFKGKIPGAK